MSNNRPTHSLCIVPRRDYEDKDTKKRKWSTIGVGWQADKGYIAISLNDGIVLDWRMNDTHKIALFPSRDPD